MIQKNEKEIYIWGAGKIGVLMALDLERKGIKITGFIYSDASKIKTRLGLQVVEPLSIIKNNNAPYIIVAIHNEKIIEEITEQLENAGLIKNKNFEIGKIYQDVHIDDYNYIPKHRDSLKNSKIGKIMEEWYEVNKKGLINLVKKICSYKKFYKKISLTSNQENNPQWINRRIPPFDAISIYAFLAINNPRYYVEIGSGNSTLFAARSIRDNNLRTKIIDPYPRVEIDKLCHKIYRIPLESMDLDFFAILSSEDILSVDNSHRSFPNSDVTVFLQKFYLYYQKVCFILCMIFSYLLIIQKNGFMTRKNGIMNNICFVHIFLGGGNGG